MGSARNPGLGVWGFQFEGFQGLIRVGRTRNIVVRFLILNTVMVEGSLIIS